MTAKVFEFTGITRLDCDPDRVLQAAVGNLDRAVVIGIDKDGEEYFASSAADGGTVLWDIERAKKRLLEMPEEFED